MAVTNYVPEFFTIKELSKFSCIGTKTLYELVNNREIEFVNIGRKIVISRADFEKWFAEHKKRTIPARPRLPEHRNTKQMFSLD